MEIGKIPNDVLKKSIISKINIKNKDVLVGPGIGEDCAVIDFGEDVCVLTTDPITAAASNAGTLGVHICCNDIASAGVRPLGVMVTVLAPPSAELEDIAKVMEEVNEACSELGIDVLGGHTEVTDGVNRLIISITAIGKGRKNEFVTTGGARINDDIVVTGFAGLEGTAILSNDYGDYLRKSLGDNTIDMAQSLLKNISVVKVGLLASSFGVNAMHDATEGGILGAIWEVAEASDLGVYINKKDIPIKKETIEICGALKIDPYKLISSGSMIIAASDGYALSNYLGSHGIDAKVVGKIKESGMIINVNGIEEIISPPESDEIYKVKV